jgi:hypothetical protein
LPDARGHVYVSRLKRGPAEFVATLVELDSDLQEVRESPLQHYTLTPDDDSHGLVGIQPLADHSHAFVTDRGCLYRIRPPETGPAAVEELGMFHPKGEAYVGSLFSYDGVRFLVGLSRRQWDNDNRYEWLAYDLIARKSVAVPIVIPTIDDQLPTNLLLYGSTTRDDDGNFYLVGTYHRASRDWPIAFRAQLPLGQPATP